MFDTGHKTCNVSLIYNKLGRKKDRMKGPKIRLVKKAQSLMRGGLLLPAAWLKRRTLSRRVISGGKKKRIDSARERLKNHSRLSRRTFEGEKRGVVRVKEKKKLGRVFSPGQENRIPRE